MRRIVLLVRQSLFIADDVVYIFTIFPSVAFVTICFSGQVILSINYPDIIMRKKIYRTGAYFILLLLSALFISTNTSAQKAVPSKIKYSEYSIKIIPAAANSYGYEISKDNRVIIRQPGIPGMPGNKGFKLKADAKKVASLAVSKLSHGMMPPTIEKMELDKLHIHY